MSKETKPFSDELVKDATSLIVNDPAIVTLGSKVFSAVEAILRDPRTKTVYVVDEKKKLVGIITVSDLLKISCIQIGGIKRPRLLGFFKYMSLLYSETVEDIMRTPISTRDDEKLIHALQLMEKNNLSALPVVDKNNTIVGELNGLEILTVIYDKIECGELEKLV
ncbi:MAG: CBS domain-containing protein [Thermoplasmata archaeon]|nr:MAG: CBS domain-containing protein [Thermoplasmata archaeon]